MTVGLWSEPCEDAVDEGDEPHCSDCHLGGDTQDARPERKGSHHEGDLHKTRHPCQGEFMAVLPEKSVENDGKHPQKHVEPRAPEFLPHLRPQCHPQPDANSSIPAPVVVPRTVVPCKPSPNGDQKKDKSKPHDHQSTAHRNTSMYSRLLKI